MVGVLVHRGPGVRRGGVFLVAWVDRQGVADQQPAGRRAPRGDEDVGARLVVARDRVVDAVGAEAEVAGAAVEQAAEDTGRVERRYAQPAHRAVGRDKRAGVAVGQERVVLDGRERRGRGGALRYRIRLDLDLD